MWGIRILTRSRFRPRLGAPAFGELDDLVGAVEEQADTDWGVKNRVRMATITDEVGDLDRDPAELFHHPTHDHFVRPGRSELKSPS